MVFIKYNRFDGFAMLYFSLGCCNWFEMFLPCSWINDVIIYFSGIAQSVPVLFILFKITEPFSLIMQISYGVNHLLQTLLFTGNDLKFNALG